MPYPEYPSEKALQDWNSDLLTVDGYIAGYASQVCEGILHPIDVPDVDGLAREVDLLRRKLERLSSKLDQDSVLISDYRDYLSSLTNVIRELRILAV